MGQTTIIGPISKRETTIWGQVESTEIEVCTCVEVKVNEQNDVFNPELDTLHKQRPRKYNRSYH